MGAFEAEIMKTYCFVESLEDKVSEIVNEIRADVLGNLNKNYANRLLDVKEAKLVRTRY